MLYVPLEFGAYENYGLLDTAAIQSAMSENELRRLLQTYPAPDFRIQITNGTITSPSPFLAEKDIGTVTGTVEAFPSFGRKTELLLSPLMSEILEQRSYAQITNHMDHAITIPQNTTIALFKILTPNQA